MRRDFTFEITSDEEFTSYMIDFKAKVKILQLMYTTYPNTPIEFIMSEHHDVNVEEEHLYEVEGFARLRDDEVNKYVNGGKLFIFVRSIIPISQKVVVKGWIEYEYAR